MATQTIEVPSKKPGLRERLDLGNGLTQYFLVLPTVLVILAVAVYPILYSLWLSSLDNPLGPSAQFIGLNNYVQLFARGDFLSSISTTLIFTTIAVPSALPVLSGLMPRRRGISKRSHTRAVGRDVVLAAAQTGLTITMLAHQAWLMSDAIVRTLLALQPADRFQTPEELLQALSVV